MRVCKCAYTQACIGRNLGRFSYGEGTGPAKSLLIGRTFFLPRSRKGTYRNYVDSRTLENRQLFVHFLSSSIQFLLSLQYSWLSFFFIIEIVVPNSYHLRDIFAPSIFLSNSDSSAELVSPS